MRTTSSQRLATATARSNTPAAQTWRQTLRPQPVQACRLCTLSPCECCISICFDRLASVPHLLGRSHMSASADVRFLLDVQSLPWKSICARTRCGRRCASSSATATTCRRLPPGDRSWRPQLSPKRPTLQTSGCGAPRYVVMHVAHHLGDKHWPHPFVSASSNFCIRVTQCQPSACTFYATGTRQTGISVLHADMGVFGAAGSAHTVCDAAGLFE